MPYDVLLCQVNHTDAFHAIEYLECLLQSAALLTRQVDLREVACDDHLGVHSHTGEEHANLLGGGVLCLVEDDDGIAEGASTHEGERRYLDDVLLHHVL